MDRHYGPSTRRRMGELESGMRVQTEVLDNTTLLAAAGSTNIFTVYGRILVTQLYIEAITAFSADATTVLFQYEGVTTAVGAADMCGASGVLTSIAQGIKIKYLGGAVATGASINVGEACITPHIIGTATIAGVQPVGLISTIDAGVTQKSGTCQVVIHYVPMEDGSRVVSLL